MNKQYLDENIQNIDWVSIKKAYPKAHRLFYNFLEDLDINPTTTVIGGYEKFKMYVEDNLKYLYHFFEYKHSINIDVTIDYGSIVIGKPVYIWKVLDFNTLNETSNSTVEKVRINATIQAFEGAFYLLENKL